MWHRRRVTNFAWTRPALDVPVVARYAPALVAEVLEDRTLLTGISDSPGNDSWEGLLGSNSALVFLVPIDAISGLVAKDVGETLAPTIDDVAPRDVDTPLLSIRVASQANWHDLLHLPIKSDGSSAEGSQVLVTVELDSADPSDGAVRFVNVSLGLVAGAEFGHDISPSVQSRTGLATVSDLSQPEPIFQAIFLWPAMTQPIGLLSIAWGSSMTTPPQGSFTTPASVDEFCIRQELATRSLEFTNLPTRDRGNFSDVQDADFGCDLSMISVRSLAHPTTVFSKSSADSGVGLDVKVSTESTTVVFAGFNLAESPGASDLAAIVITPEEGLQAAAAPLVIVVETVLATLDTTARTMFALLTGSGGGTSPIASVIQPIMDSTPIVIDPKRPRWALHNGVAEELAAYSLVVAPDQHFDLKDFGPASRAADPVVRIEFDVPPLHGLVSATEVPGSFRYSADPGFSGVDAARFRITRASGQTVAGAVTILVGDHGLPDRPAASVRQVELPIGDQRVSDIGEAPGNSTLAIDASFRLSDGWMDLP